MRGKPDGFGEKSGKIDTYTFGGRRKLRGENFEPRKTSHCSARNTHTKTGCEKAVCTNTNTVRLPLSDLERKPKVSSKVYITTRPAKHIHPEKAENKSSKSSLGSVKAATIAVTVVTPWHSSMFSLRRRSRRTPRNGRSFPPSESSQRSIKR